MGKICGYFLGSFWCMGIAINFLLKFETNLRFAYLSCAVLGILLLLFVLICFPEPKFEDKNVEIIIAKNPLRETNRKV